MVKTILFGLMGLVLALALMGVGAALAAGADPKDKKADDKASLWMTKKLEFSQGILAGLTKGDFDRVEKNATDMYVVGYLEKADMAESMEYRRQIKSFDASTKDLIRHAKAKDSPAATKAYVQMIASCVECHKVLRDAKKK